MPCDYVAIDGSIKPFDLDLVIDIADGYSGKKNGWSALLIFLPKEGAFVELRSSPPDVRGNGPSEQEEVDDAYIASIYQLNELQIVSIKTKPTSWKFVQRLPKNVA